MEMIIINQYMNNSDKQAHQDDAMDEDLMFEPSMMI
jgi:hypothetical protein